MTEVTADTIALRIVVDAERAQREVRAYGASVERTMATVEAATARGGADALALRTADAAKAIAAARGASAALARELSAGLAQAIVRGESLGEVLENAFLKAGAAALRSRIFDLLAVGDIGRLFRAVATPVAAPGRASGGHVSAGQLYRVNEAGTEGFRPAGSGTIVPLGRMAAPPRGGGVTVVQPLNVSFAGAITTPELMAQFKAYADGVGQAAAIGGAAMAQARIARRASRALPR